MSQMYHLVQRPDKSEGAGPDAKLYYGQIRVRQQITFDQLCETIADRSTASKGDVQVVLDGLIHVLNQQLQNGNSVQMGDFGSFRMSCGSKGVITKEEFDTSLFKKGKIIFTPGAKLKSMAAQPKFERIEVVKPTEDEEETV